MAGEAITASGPTITVSTSLELLDAYAQLSSQSGGGTILLQGGEFGYLALYGSSGGGEPVIIASADPSDPAQFDKLFLSGVSNLRFEDLHIDSPENGSAGSSVVQIVDGSQNIELVNLEINGLVDDFYNGHYGVLVKDSNDIGLYDSDIHDVKNGIYVDNSGDIEIVGNNLDYLGNDGMKFSGVTGILIEDNTGPRFVYPEPDAHLDFIQFQGADSSDIVIRGNVLLPENWTGIQGIFLDDAHYTNVLIEQNIIVTGSIHGVSLSSGTNVIARDNTVLDLAGYGSKATLVMVDGESYGNLQGSYLQAAGVGDNLTLQQTHPDEPLHYDDVFVNADAGVGITLEDLTPVEGSLAYEYGATERLLELLGMASGTSGEDTPAEDPPTEDPPAEDPPAEDPPAEDPPAEDPPAEDPPADEPLEMTLTLIDTTTDEVIMTLVSGDELPLDILGRSDVSVAVNVNQDIGSVRLTLGDFVQIENAEPYSLFGDNSGDFRDGGEAPFQTAGNYLLGVQLFSGPDATGELLGAADYSLTLTEEDITPPGEDPRAEDPPADDTTEEDPPADNPGGRGDAPEAVEGGGGGGFFLSDLLEMILRIFGLGGNDEPASGPATETAAAHHETLLDEVVPVTEMLDETLPDGSEEDDPDVDLAA